MRRGVLFSQSGMPVGSCVGFALVGILLGAMIGCGGSSPAPGVSVSASSATVDGADTATLTATVANDKNSAGVTWSTSAGTLSNETTTSATFTAPAATSSSQTVTITATSVVDTTKTGTVTVTIPAAPSVTSTNTSLTGAVGTAYSVTLTASGGIAPYTWSLGTGTTLPACLTLKSSGVITTASGLPPTASCAGTYSNLTFTATDSGTPTALSATSSPLSITIAAAPAIVFSTTSLAAGTVGTSYSASVAATGGVGTLTYSVTGGALPIGLTLSSAGVISGKPTTAGASSFTVTASDAYGDSASTTSPLSITINNPALSVTTTSLPAGVANVLYSSQSLVASGGSGTGYSWVLTNGTTLPAGMSLSSGGVVSGTPTTAGTTMFTVKVTDSASDTATGTVSITINAGLSVTTASIPNGTVGTTYSTTLAASGGTGSGYTWTITSGASSLTGVGLSMSSGGTISGTPTTPETAAAFTVQVTDSGSDKATVSLALTVSYGALNITTTNLPGATINASYSETFQATGGSGNYSWSLTAGASGLNGVGISLSTGGVLSGTPSATGSYPFTVEVTDTTTSNTLTASYTLVVSSAVAASCTHDGSANAILNGSYAFLLSGFDPNGNNYAVIGDFKANGGGAISSGNGDANSSGFATSGEQQYAFTGTYSIGDSANDNRGITTWNNTNTSGTGLPAQTSYCFSADAITGGVAQSGRIIEADGSGYVLTGFFVVQNPSDFTTAALSTGYAFGIQGVNKGTSGTGRAAIVGQATFNGSGGIPSGQIDIAEYDPTSGSTTYQAAQSNPSGSTYSVASNGRGTMTIGSGASATPFVIYLVGTGNEVLILSADNVNTGTLLVGQGMQQTTTSFTAASLNGPSVFREIGADANNSPVTDDVGVGQLSFNGSGAVSGLADMNDGGILSGPNTLSANYTVSSIGYVQVSGGTGKHPPNFYFYAPGSGFGLDGSGSVDLYFLSAQTVPSGGFTNASLTGSYAVGTLDPAAYNGTGSNQYPQILDATVTFGSGTLSITSDNVSAPGLAADVQVDQTDSNTFALDSSYGATTGRFVVSSGGSPDVVGYIVSPTQVYLIQATSGQDGLTIEADSQQ